MGLLFVGPQAPNGRQADPWPDELPVDFVFASDSFGDSLTVRAVNSPEQWGPSDHCQLEIEIP